MPPLPPDLVRNAVDAWGEDGRRWLDGLPSLLSALAAEWRLRPEAVTPYDLSFHWVVPVRREDGTDAVLKLGPPGPGHLDAEAAALELFAGGGAVRLLEYDRDRGALLLERARPGTPLSSLVPDEDAAATAAFVQVARGLRRAAPEDSPLPVLERAGVAFSRHLAEHPGDGPLPRSLVERAGALFAELCADAPERVVLHGDLHHDNILRCGSGGWLAIDPHGYVGDPGYETGALFYNPAIDDRDPALLGLVPARIEQVADGLGIPPDRVAAWAFVKAVLSEVWTAEGGGRPGSRALDVALSLADRLP
ncbi:phosphotransferase [Actinomadura graeca]|uniref:Phosphotransferase n=1 Tax=Actinomadura graeca TaxID=2750812 RepID=A0ABX8QQV8_9ACTN|nr:aminoglycoside phosphotransferase family protein [Actinomadura graeca]QXJ20584.1 phosphotransferase [Actinomadura graeca]